MKVLYSAFDPVPFPKGSGSRIEATVRALAEAGVKVTLHTPQALAPIAGFPPKLTGANIEHQPVLIEKENFIERVLAFRHSVESVLKTNSFDAAIFRSPWEGLPIINSPIFSVYEVHGFPSIELASHFPKVRNHSQIMDRLIGEENLCLAHSKLCLTPSQTSRYFLLRRGVHPDKVRVIPNSFDPIDAAISPLEPPSQVVRIGYMGTLAPWQGLETLMEAISLLRKGGSQFRLEIAGTRKGHWYRRLRQLASYLKIKEVLEIHGPLGKEDLFSMLCSCHILAAPLPDDPRNGLQGCCPIKILEYMACSRPILSTRIPPVEEILTDGETACLVPPNSSSWLARGLERIVSNYEKANTYAQAARQQLITKYSRAQFKQQIAELTKEIAHCLNRKHTR